MTGDPEHLAKAKALTARLEAKVDELLAPLEFEMQTMRWAPEFRAIMWEVVGHKALARAKEAAK
jgi:hypothetical protein